MYLRSIVTVEDLLDFAAVKVAPGSYRLFQESTRRWHTLARYRHRQVGRSLTNVLRSVLMS